MVWNGMDITSLMGTLPNDYITPLATRFRTPMQPALPPHHRSSNASPGGNAARRTTPNFTPSSTAGMRIGVHPPGHPAPARRTACSYTGCPGSRITPGRSLQPGSQDLAPDDPQQAAPPWSPAPRFRRGQHPHLAHPAANCLRMRCAPRMNSPDPHIPIPPARTAPCSGKM